MLVQPRYLSADLQCNCWWHEQPEWVRCQLVRRSNDPLYALVGAVTRTLVLKKDWNANCSTDFCSGWLLGAIYRQDA